METENDELHRLIESAKPAMAQDAAYVALGLQTRVMANLESSSRSEDALSQWGSAFLRGAFVSVTVALALGARNPTDLRCGNRRWRHWHHRGSPGSKKEDGRSQSGSRLGSQASRPVVEPNGNSAR